MISDSRTTQAIVVAPHPDDEVLGCSAVLHRRDATVIQVTDGVPPWTDAEARDQLRSACRAECIRAWASLSSRVDLVELGFPDLRAWKQVGEIASKLVEVIGSVPQAEVFLPAYQRGHPDHDAAYLAGAWAREQLPEEPGRSWWVYGLYGFDESRRLRFGWLPPDVYGPVEAGGSEPDLLEAKSLALRQFTSQVWPGSALDLWLNAPVEEQFAPLPDGWDRRPPVAAFYDEELDFGRHGASAEAVESAFRKALADRVG